MGRQIWACGGQGLKKCIFKHCLVVGPLTSSLPLLLLSSHLWVPAPGPYWLLTGVACVQLRHSPCEHGYYKENQKQQGLSLDQTAMEGIKCSIFCRVSGTVAISPLPLPQVSLKWLAKGSRWSDALKPPLAQVLSTTWWGNDKVIVHSSSKLWLQPELAQDIQLYGESLVSAKRASGG